MPDSILLFTEGNEIYFRIRNGDVFSRPSLLAGDYSHALTQIVFYDVLYFSYISKDKQLILRNVHNPAAIYLADPDRKESGTFCMPSLCSFQNQLLLFYLKQHENHTCQLSCDFPFSPQNNFCIPDLLETTSVYHTADLKDTLLIAVDAVPYPRIFYLNSNYQLQTMTDGSSEIERLTVSLRERDQEILRLNQTIQSASRQYKELMGIAERYRDEALKWQNKFLMP